MVPLDVRTERIWERCSMATYLFDFDGVFFRYGTMEPIDGTVELVRKLHQEGHSIIFLTKRRRFNNDPPPCV
jgi:ribonucleotide monophosphatase NagD (HAD superfamily)